MPRFCIALLILAFAAQPTRGQEIVRLWPEGPPSHNELSGPETTEGCVGNISEPTLTVSRPAPGASNGAAMLVIPGGGYWVVCMDHEGSAVADWLVSQGFTVGVLKYRMPNGHYDVPIQDAQQALRLMRSNADSWQVRPDRIGVLGFSAGGHLASTVGTHFDEDYSGGKGDRLDASHRPDFMVLVYPVVTMEAGVTHGGSRNNLIGNEPGPSLVERFSNELRISEHTPPTFLVHSSDDTVVPVANSIGFYEALVNHGISAEMHVFERGGHGYSLAPDSPSSAWAGLAETWLHRVVSDE